MNKRYNDTDGFKYCATVYGTDKSFAAICVGETPFTVTLLNGCPIRESLEAAQRDLDEYAGKNGLEQEICGSVSFPADSAEKDTCPVCGNTELLFLEGKFEGDYYISPWECPECSSYGRQMEKTAYDGHVVDMCSLAIPAAMVGKQMPE